MIFGFLKINRFLFINCSSCPFDYVSGFLGKGFLFFLKSSISKYRLNFPINSFKV